MKRIKSLAELVQAIKSSADFYLYENNNHRKLNLWTIQGMTLKTILMYIDQQKIHTKIYTDNKKIPMKYTIVDLRTKKALYGAGNKTLLFSSFELADEVGSQFFLNKEEYMVIACFI